MPVRELFAGKRSKHILDGSHSIRLPHPQKKDFWLKIKGAGYMGGPIGFGQYLRTGPSAPVFDFDGRMMEDIASGHDNAYAPYA